jgi:SAM-dependent methyltransferase
MIKTFISYTKKDREFLEKSVLKIIKKYKVNVWYDKNATPGNFWIEEVNEKIRHGDLLVILITENYQAAIKNKSGACYHELNWMVNHVTTARFPGKIIAVLESGELPDIIKATTCIDIRDDKNLLEVKFKELLAERVEPIDTQEKILPERKSLQSPINYPDDLIELVRFNFDSIASDYQEQLLAGNAMQTRDAVSLLYELNRFWSKTHRPRPHAWLDAGGGTGLIASVAKWRKEHECDWLLDSKIRGSFDFSPRMITIQNILQQGERQGPPLYTHRFESDLRKINQDVLNENIGRCTVDLVIANNVLHWLYFESQIEKILLNCKDLLNHEGVLATSIAAVGTGLEFFKSYKNVMSEILCLEECEKWKNHLENPIGLQKLECITSLARKTGYDVVMAKCQYEPVEYKTTDEYVEDARRYGEQVFMAPLLNKDIEYNKVWDKIKEMFEDLYKKKQRKYPQKAYIHDQFTIFLIACKVI